MSDDPRVRASQAKIELRETEKAYDGLRAALIAKWADSPAEAVKTRETCYFAVQALDLTRKALRQAVDTGMIAEAAEEMTRKGRDTPFIQPIRGAA